MNALRWMAPLAVAALVAVPLGAQDMGAMHGARDEGQMMDHGMMQMCSMMMGGGDMAGHQGMMAGGDMAGQRGMMAGMHTGAMSMFGGVELDLTADQTEKIDQIVASAREAHQGHMKAVMDLRRSAAESLKGPSPDLGAYEGTLQEAATHQVQAHLTLARAAIDAKGLLTAEQVALLPEGAQLVNGMMCGMMRGGMAGMMDHQPGDSEGRHDQHHR